MYKPPSIPPIQNIADKPTKDALLALTEGWQVRNGMSGSGKDRFITKDEFDLAMKKMGIVAPTPAQESPGTIASYSAGTATSSTAVDLLPLNNTWSGTNTFEQATPASLTADNWHIKFSRDGLARWNFALGHALGAATINNANNGSAQNSTGNLYLTDPGRSSTDTGGIAAILYPFSKGSGMRLFGRLSFDSDQINKTLIQFRDTQKIGWESTGAVTTYFNPYTGILGTWNGSIERFGIHVVTGDWYQNGTNQSARINALETSLGNLWVIVNGMTKP